MKRSFVCSCRKVFELAFLVCGDFVGNKEPPCFYFCFFLDTSKQLLK